MGPATPLVPTTKICLPLLRNLVWFLGLSWTKVSGLSLGWEWR